MVSVHTCVFRTFLQAKHMDKQAVRAVSEGGQASPSSIQANAGLTNLRTRYWSPIGPHPSVCQKWSKLVAGANGTMYVGATF